MSAMGVACCASSVLILFAIHATLRKQDLPVLPASTLKDLAGEGYTYGKFGRSRNSTLIAGTNGALSMSISKLTFQLCSVVEEIDFKYADRAQVIAAGKIIGAGRQVMRIDWRTDS